MSKVIVKDGVPYLADPINLPLSRVATPWLRNVAAVLKTSLGYVQEELAKRTEIEP